jgi:hypothetical protein
MSDSKTASLSTSVPPRRKILTHHLGQVTWSIVRFPSLAILLVLEPLVRFVLAGSSLLCFLTAFFYRWTGVDPRFPFWGMLLSAVALASMLLIYERAIGLLSRC